VDGLKLYLEERIRTSLDDGWDSILIDFHHPDSFDRLNAWLKKATDKAYFRARKDLTS
jgi:hypothetical protein